MLILEILALLGFCWMRRVEPQKYVHLHYILGELFVVAHELGHFLNGDFEDAQCFRALNPSGGMAGIFVNKNHEREYKADEFAFATLLLILRKMNPNLPAVLPLFNGVVLLFNLFQGIGT